MNKTKLIWVVAVVAVCAYAVAHAELGPKSKAPDFTVPTISGKQFRLSDSFKTPGSVVLLSMWATWCPHCTDEVPYLIQLHRQFKGKAVRFVGVGLDEDAADVKSYAARKKIAYTICTDPKGEKAGSLYASEGVPATYIIDKTGVIRFVHVGFPPDPAGQKAETDKLRREIKSLL